MSIVISEVTSRRDRKRFIELPAELHRGHALWMPPIYRDEWDYFDPRRNRAFSYCDVTMVLARRDGRVVGRVMGLINRRHNAHVNERSARFSCLECPDDDAVAGALLGHVEAWARSRGMTRVIGPFGFNDQDPEGFLVEGFEHPPTIVTYYNFPYLIDLLARAGYTKEVDYVVHRVKVAAEIPALFERAAARAERSGFRLVKLASKRQARRYILPILGLMNRTFDGLYGYSPLDDDEMRGLAQKFAFLLDVRFVKVVEKEGEVVGFIIGIPNLHEGIVRARGRLFPFGFLHILRAARRAKQLDVLLGAVHERHRGMGVDALMSVAMVRSAHAAGFETFDTHHELESNRKIRAVNERWGGEVYKRYRIFGKGL